MYDINTVLNPWSRVNSVNYRLNFVIFNLVSAGIEKNYGQVFTFLF